MKVIQSIQRQFSQEQSGLLESLSNWANSNKISFLTAGFTPIAERVSDLLELLKKYGRYYCEASQVGIIQYAKKHSDRWPTKELIEIVFAPDTNLLKNFFLKKI